MTIASNTFKPRMSRASRFLSAALAFVLSACSVTLISHYDEQIDQAATALQKEMDAHLTNLEAASGPDATFDSNKQFYQDYLVGLRAVELRASTHPQNRQSLGQYSLMLDNLEDLRGTHETEGTLSAAYISTVRELFNQGWRAIITLEVAKKRGEG
jgi:hypothetical protein